IRIREGTSSFDTLFILVRFFRIALQSYGYLSNWGENRGISPFFGTKNEILGRNACFWGEMICEKPSSRL
ncbi:MAG: hypothetical protein K6B45_05595, partial [Bacteroidaceae bacterium]|nr:hypothetical protein [Bacteroidaceae bacterium]